MELPYERFGDLLISGLPVFDFFIEGVPIPQGSLKAVKSRWMKFAKLVQSNKSLDGWRAQVYSAIAARRQANGWELERGPVAVSLVFRLIKPKSRPKTKRTWPDTKPDLDKLARAVLDALTGAIILDDAQVVFLTAMKDWEEKGPGVHIRIWRVPSGETLPEYRKHPKTKRPTRKDRELADLGEAMERASMREG